MNGKKVGVLVVDFLITAVLAAVILMFIGWINGLIESVRFGTAMALIFGALFFIAAMKIHPGKEELLQDLPFVLLISAVFAGLASIGFQALHFVVEFTPLVSIAFGFGSVYFAKTCSTLLLKQFGVKPTKA
jgi:hypothetical protein